MAKLSDRQIQSAKTKDKDLFLSDGGGLYLRIRNSGAKVWLYRYKVANTTRWYEIGTYPDLALVNARQKSANLTAGRRKGIDPVEKQKAEEVQRAAEELKAQSQLTIRKLMARWEVHELSTRKDKGSEVKRSFEKDVLPAIGDVDVNKITRAMIVKILDTVVLRGAPIIARNMLGDIRQMFNFAIQRELVEHDPTSHLKRDDFGKKLERDRVLSDDELKVLPIKLATAGIAKQSEASIWILLSTCCRVGEISQAKWCDVDLLKGIWRIPPENSKNAKSHTVYLSKFAIEKFNELLKLAESSPWVLPASHKQGHVCTKSLAKQIGDRQRGEKPPMACRSKNINALELEGGKWTPHDLRRTGATIMGVLGVRPDVIEKCLNHVEQNRMVRTYQRQKLEVEQQAAWKLLGDHLDSLKSEVEQLKESDTPYG